MTLAKKDAIEYCNALQPLKLRRVQDVASSCVKKVWEYRPLLFQLFGEARHERVVHEFVAALLDNPLMRTETGCLLSRLVADFGENEVHDTDVLVVDSESGQRPHGIRIDILVKNLTKCWELAIELKMRPGADRQVQGYHSWLNGNLRRYVVWVGVSEPPRSHARAKAWPWARFGRAIVEKTCGATSCPPETRTFVVRFAKGLARMNGDIDTFEALQWYYARKENAALVALAHWDAVLLQKEYKLTREDIKAAEALQEWVEKETDSLINLAEGILAEVCKESGAVKEHKPKPNRRRRNECELPVLPKGAWAKKKKREHGEIGATLWRDTAGRPALILWVFLPKGECFNQIKDGSSDDLFLLFGHRASRVLDQVPLRKKGGGGKVKVGGVFKSRQEIEQDFRARAKQALLHSGKGKKNLLQRLAAAASSK